MSVDFTANGKPESVYHWNLPLGIVPSTTTETTTLVPSTTTPIPPTSTSVPFNNKKPYRHNYYNNGKPHKLYFVKPFYNSPSTTTEAPPAVTTTLSVGVVNKKHQFKKNFYGNGKPNQLYFVQPAATYSPYSV